MIDKNYVLYILMNCDLSSMCYGKAIAQGSHASALFLTEASEKCERERMEWIDEGDGFGTTIVLKSNEQELKNLVYHFKDSFLDCGLVLDKTYPFIVDQEIKDLLDSSKINEDETIVLDDRRVLATREAITCGYFFVEKGSYQQKLFKNLELF